MPAAIVGVGLWFNRQQQERQREAERTSVHEPMCYRCTWTRSGNSCWTKTGP